MSVEKSVSTPTRGRRALQGAVLVIVAGLVAWRVLQVSDGDRTQPVALADVVQHGAAAGFNVVLITLDTTRPDHLGCYGAPNARTPTIDALLDHGVRFDDAVTSVPLTLPSHATILTGRYPPAIGVRDNGLYMLSADHVTLPEILKHNGYDTAAFVSAFVLDKRFGLNQGFDTYEFKAEIEAEHKKGSTSFEHERRADTVTNSAIGWIKARSGSNADTPFFLWVHYFDPHAPYDSPIEDLGLHQGSPYDAEIAFVDMHLKRLLAAIDEQALRDRTLILLTSDHGESLFEHDEPLHGIFVYEATMHAALILSCPTLFDGPYRVDDRVVGTVDILPTVVDFLGLPLPTPLDGLSLLTANVPPDRAIYVETYFTITQGCSPLYGLRRHTDKYILAPQPEYYDLREDPTELDNLYDDSPAAAGALGQQLAEMMAAWSADESAHSGARLPSNEDMEGLLALGYAGAGGHATSDALPDPKDHIVIINQMTEVTRLQALGQLEEAVELAKEVAAQSAGWDAPVLKACEILNQLDRREEAVQMLTEFCKQYTIPGMVYYLAQSLYAAKRYDECLEVLRDAEQFDPQLGSVPALRGDVLFQRERYRQAAEQYRKALEIDGERLGPEIRDKLRMALDRSRPASPQ